MVGGAIGLQDRILSRPEGADGEQDSEAFVALYAERICPLRRMSRKHISIYISIHLSIRNIYKHTPTHTLQLID